MSGNIKEALVAYLDQTDKPLFEGVGNVSAYLRAVNARRACLPYDVAALLHDVTIDEVLDAIKQEAEPATRESALRDLAREICLGNREALKIAFQLGALTLEDLK